MSTETARKLRTLLDAVFEDAVVEVKEREQIGAIVSGGDLTEAEVTSVFASFIEKKWGEASADGVISPQERLLLSEILRELKLPEEAIPPQVRMAILHD